MILQNRINKWQKKTFPKSVQLSKLKHLRKEIDELEECLKSNDKNKMELSLELADCAFLLFGIAGLENINLLKSVKIKLKINKKRKWGIPDKDGVYLHIKGEQNEKDN